MDGAIGRSSRSRQNLVESPSRCHRSLKLDYQVVGLMRLLLLIEMAHGADGSPDREQYIGHRVHSQSPASTIAP